MILCGSIADPALRERLTNLAEGKGWNSWFTREACLLRPMLEALTASPDAVISDDRVLLMSLTDPKPARILLADQAEDDPTLFVVSHTDDDRALLQQLFDCINTSRLKSRLKGGRNREPITHLPRHQELVSTLADYQGRPVALLVVQVDHAEHLYANLDPVSRTDLLEALATRFKLIVPPAGVIGFYDAGCFIVALPGLSADDLMHTADGIRAAARDPLRYRGGEIHLTVSIGCNHVASYEHYEVLWQGAWRAVNRATQAGGNRTEGGPADHISSRLPSALERDEFSLMLQGQWNGDRLTGVEALLRWQGLEVGELAPSHFIAVAEREGFITRIGDWVLEHASTTAASWLEHHVQPLLLGVNVSPQQFVNGAISEQIQRLRSEHWLDPSMLELELSQANLLTLVDEHRNQMYQLRDWGVRFAIDNLGTDLINFDRLLRCPADTLKIDRSLIAKITSHPASRDLIGEIAGIGERFNLRVVAVGVEAPEQLEALARLGDIDLQGYLLSPPVPIGEFHQLLSAGPDLEQEL